MWSVKWRDGSAHLEGDSGPLTPLSEEDLAAGRLAVRLAAAAIVSAVDQSTVTGCADGRLSVTPK